MKSPAAEFAKDLFGTSIKESTKMQRYANDFVNPIKSPYLYSSA